MSELAVKTILCGIRTAGTLGVVALAFWGARYVGWSYDDTRIVLGLVNGYFPEIVLLLGIGGGALIFVRMSRDPDNDFDFAKFFMAGGAYDIYRFGYFWLLIFAGWILFVTAWRDKPVEALAGIVLGAFVVKGVADSVAGAFGRQRETQETKT